MSVADQIDSYLKAQLGKVVRGGIIILFGGGTYTFQTDAGQLVDKNLEYTEHPDDMPSLVYFTGRNSTDFASDPQPELGMENHLQELSVEGFIECDKAGTEGDQLKQDISCALKADPFWGGLIEHLESFESNVAIQNGETVFAVVKVSATALYTVPFGSE